MIDLRKENEKKKYEKGNQCSECVTGGNGNTRHRADKKMHDRRAAVSLNLELTCRSAFQCYSTCQEAADFLVDLFIDQ